MIKCNAIDCDVTFVPLTPSHKYCSDKCRWRESKRNAYEKRKKKGLCPQCGKSSLLNSSNKPSYCEDCIKYFKNYYKNKKRFID